MVLLHFPFRNEEVDILIDHKYLSIFENHLQVITENRKVIDSSLDMEKTIDLYRKLCAEECLEEELTQQLQRLINNEQDNMKDFFDVNTIMTKEIFHGTIGNLSSIVGTKQNVLPKEEFNYLMRLVNSQQRGLIMEVIHRLLSPDDPKFTDPIQIFFTGPAGFGKTFYKIIKSSAYNRFSDTDGFCNAFIACASTGKAAVAIDAVTVHTAFKISLSALSDIRLKPNLYRFSLRKTAYGLTQKVYGFRLSRSFFSWQKLH